MSRVVLYGSCDPGVRVGATCHAYFGQSIGTDGTMQYTHEHFMNVYHRKSTTARVTIQWAVICAPNGEIIASKAHTSFVAYEARELWQWAHTRAHSLGAAW
jgi:hypothetical protein